MFLFFDFLLVCVVKQKLSLDSKETLNVSNYHDIYTERGLTIFPPGDREFQLSIHINFPRERYDIENVSFTIDQTVSFMVYLTTEEQESITVNMHFITIIYQFKDCIKMPGILSLFIKLSTGDILSVFSTYQILIESRNTSTVIVFFGLNALHV